MLCTGVPVPPEPWAVGHYTLRYHGTVVSVCGINSSYTEVFFVSLALCNLVEHVHIHGYH